MSRTHYSEGPLRAGMHPADKAALREMAESLSRISQEIRFASGGTNDPTTLNLGLGVGNDSLGQNSGQVILAPPASTITQLPPSPAGTRVSLILQPGSTIRDGIGNLILPHDITVQGRPDIVDLVSVGDSYYQVGRGATSAETFVHLNSKFGIRAGQSVATMTNLIQNAIDTVDEGSVLWLSPADVPYEMETGRLTRGNISFYLPPGAYLKGVNTAAPANLFEVQGSETAITKLLVADLLEGQSSDTFATTGVNIELPDTTDLVADQWIIILDDQTSRLVTSTTRHMEINRIRRINDATHIELYYQPVDTYVTSLNARIIVCTPIENVWFYGGGRMSNHGITTSEGGHSLRFGLAVNCGATGLTIEDTRNHALKFEETLSCRAIDMLLRDAPWFNSNGYGVTTSASVDTIIAFCRTYRTRHAFDISFFSRDTTIISPHARSCAFTALQIHPNTKRTTFHNPIVDGVRGYDDATGQELAPGSNQGHGFECREDTTEVAIHGGLFANINICGISIDNSYCSNIVCDGQTYYRCNLRGAIKQATIYANDRGNLSNSLPGLRITNQKLFDCYGVGAYVTWNNAEVDGIDCWRQRPGTDSPFRSSGATGVAYGVLVGPRDYRYVVSVGPPEVTAEGGAPIGGVWAGIRIRNVRCRDDLGNLTTGVVFGKATFVATVGYDWTHTLVDCKAIDCEVEGATQSGLLATPDSAVAGGFTALSTFGERCSFINPVARECNTSDSNDHAGIVAADVEGLDPLARFDVFNPRCEHNLRYGMIFGFNASLVDEPKIHDTQVLIGCLGLWIRSFVAGYDVDDVVIRLPHSFRNSGEGIRIGSDLAAAVGNIHRCRIVMPTIWNNINYGLSIRERADETWVIRSTGWGNTIAKIQNLGTNTHYEEDELDKLTFGGV